MGIVEWLYIWPHLPHQSRVEALRPPLVLHSFRFIGLTFVVPGVVSPDFPGAFATGAAYGDLVAGILAALTYTAVQTVDVGTHWAAMLLNAGPTSAPAG